MTKTIKVVLIILVIIVLAAIKMAFQAAEINPGFIMVILMFAGLVAIRKIWKYEGN